VNRDSTEKLLIVLFGLLTHLSAFKEHAFIFGLTLAPLDVFWGISYIGPLSLTLLYIIL
jgi:hypothetical protein